MTSKRKLLATVVAGGVVLAITASQSFAQTASLTESWRFCRPTAQVRGADPAGCGAFTCTRGERVHRAVDYLAEPGQTVVAPIDGVIARVGYAYAGETRLHLVEIHGAHGLTARLLYVDPDLNVGYQVVAGEPIGVAEDVRVHYPQLTALPAHIHLDLWIDGERVDAEHDERLVRFERAFYASR